MCDHACFISCVYLAHTVTVHSYCTCKDCYGIGMPYIWGEQWGMLFMPCMWGDFLVDMPLAVCMHVAVTAKCEL